jgi:hypothetical protein
MGAFPRVGAAAGRVHVLAAVEMAITARDGSQSRSRTHDLKNSIELYERRGVGRDFGARDYE